MVALCVSRYRIYMMLSLTGKVRVQQVMRPYRMQSLLHRFLQGMTGRLAVRGERRGALLYQSDRRVAKQGSPRPLPAYDTTGQTMVGWHS